MASKTVFYRCRCFLTENYFLKKYRLHVNFHTKEQFEKDHGKELENAGCRTSGDLEEVLAEIGVEYRRRLGADSDSLDRRQLVSKAYVALHPHLYALSEAYFDSRFLDLVERCRLPDTTIDDIHDSKLVIVEHRDQRIYSFPVFTPHFGREFLQEIKHFENSDLPKGRPNSMNDKGVLLSEMGFEDNFLVPLREHYLQPLASLLYPDWGGDNLDSHRAFVVVYENDSDEGLDLHYDNAEITLNVSLGEEEFEGGELYFGSMWDDPVRSASYKKCIHQPHYGLLHRARHRHGAMPLENGKRYNLIMWMRSSAKRNALCPRCRRVPEPVPSKYYGDGFTESVT